MYRREFGMRRRVAVLRTLCRQPAGCRHGWWSISYDLACKYHVSRPLPHISGWHRDIRYFTSVVGLSSKGSLGGVTEDPRRLAVAAASGAPVTSATFFVPCCLALHFDFWRIGIAGRVGTTNGQMGVTLAHGSFGSV